MSEWSDLVAIVTGGASGIGWATARRLSSLGVRVAVLDLAEPPESGDRIRGWRVDIADDASVVAAVGSVADRWGRVDVLVNNAGIGAQGRVEDNSDEEWHRVFDVNVVGVVRVTRAALPHLRRSPTPSIVNTCSVVAGVGLPNRALYSATKGAVQALTLAMAADLLADGIRVNAVSPGTADTPWVSRLLAAADDPAAERAALEARQPLGRLVSPDEVAAAIVHLADPANASTTGTVLTVDGGLTSLRVPARP